MQNILFVAFCTLLSLSLIAQEKPALTPADYDQWESFGARQISPDGKWLAYVVRRVDQQSELRIRNLETDSLKIVAYGTNPIFSNTSKWLSYQITPSKEEKEKLENNPNAIQNKTAVVTLASWEEQVFEKTVSFNFDESGNYLALKSYPEEKAKGANLLILDLIKGTQLNFGAVKDFAWADKAALLAMIMETASKTGNGVQLFNPISGVFQVLDAAPAEYGQLSWRKDAADLAVLRTKEEKEETFLDKQRLAIVWTGLTGKSAVKKIFDPAENEAFPKNARISEHRRPTWAKEKARIYFEIQPRATKETEKDTTNKDKKEKLSDVQVWHSQDLRIFPQQKARHSRDSRRGLLCQWDFDSDSFLRIGADAMQSTRILKNDRHALETDNIPYPFGLKFGRYYENLYLIDLDNGERSKIVDKVRYNLGASPGGAYLLYFKEKDYWVYDIKQGVHVNITEKTGANFVNEAFDYPVQQRPPFYIAGWEEGDKSVLIYDEFDIWRITPNGKTAQKLTDGAKNKVIYRYLRLDPEAEAIDLSRSLYCRKTGKFTKKTGFARIDPKGTLVDLIYNEKSINSLLKAKSADVYSYIARDFSTSPNIFITNNRFDSPVQKTFLNDFQKNYAWGRSELVDFTSAGGKELQAALFYPANYDPLKKYPMIVYTYEIVSNWVNRYFTPSEQSLYNFTTYTSEGYFVLAPDIVYQAREPGRSAVESVEGAVKKVLERGVINAKGIGLVGHSWGGYQATYIPTQTDVFAASVAGAPITNFLSFMGAIHWNPGIPEVDHWETGQARMDVPYWEDFEAHVRNSPASFVHELKTPMLMAFGDSDGVVDWRQGVEFYNYARRAGNEDFVLLVYPGEDHGIAGKEHRKDYNQRIREWFAHYLKGEPAKEWIKQGVSFDEREKMLKKK